MTADIDGLPLNSEGYGGAKNILKGEYGKTSEIINAYVRNIFGAPHRDKLRSEEGERFLQDLITQSTIAGNSGQIGTSEWNVNERPQKN